MMMKRLLTTIVLCHCLFAGFAQNQKKDQAMPVIERFKAYYNNHSVDSLYAMLSPNAKKALTSVQLNSLFTPIWGQLGRLNKATFIDSVHTNLRYKGEFEKSLLTINLVLNQSAELESFFFTEYKEPQNKSTYGKDYPVTIKVMSGSISGVISIPENSTTKVPLVIIIPGSGATDRDGNAASSNIFPNTYKLLAESLNAAGTATLRYDKRGVGLSTTSLKETDLKFDDYVDDAIAIVNFIKSDTRFSKIVILGHSEGSLIGMIAAKEGPVNGFISIAGAGEPADQIVIDQMKNQPDFKGKFQKVLDSIRVGKIQKNVDPSIYFLARPTIQEYLMSWFKFDPSKEIRKLKIPILIIQGSNDIQVSIGEADKLKKAKSSATLILIDNMNHVMKVAPKDAKANVATYSNPELPLHPQLIDPILKFIKSL